MFENLNGAENRNVSSQQWISRQSEHSFKKSNLHHTEACNERRDPSWASQLQKTLQRWWAVGDDVRLTSPGIEPTFRTDNNWFNHHDPVRIHKADAFIFASRLRRCCCIRTTRKIKKKSNLHHARGIALMRVTSGGACSRTGFTIYLTLGWARSSVFVFHTFVDTVVPLRVVSK